MKSDSKKKFRAILIGGLVVGVGAAVTLAAWNDSEFAQGTFSSGQFNLEGSSTSSTTGFADHPEGGPATLAFEVNAAELSPGDTIYAPFAVRLDAATTNSASVAVSAAATGTTTGLTYQLVEAGTFGCDASTEGNDLVSAGTAIGTVAGAPTFALPQGTDGAAGQAKNLCFIVTAGENLPQGQNATATWEFAATSEAN